MFAACAAAAAAQAYLPLSRELAVQFTLWRPLLLLFGVINAGVPLAINPWRADRLPDRFPNIVQDTIIIGLLAVVAILVLQERILAMTAVGAVVVGFALQDTLGNLFAGLAIQVEKPFRVGHWVTIGGRDGAVTEITWRATKIRTLQGNLIIVPNSVLARDAVTNYSEPTTETRVDVEIGAGYDTPPNDVKAAILDAIADEPLVAGGRPPDVIIAEFGASAVNYRVRVWVGDFSNADRVRDRVRSCVYYAFRRRGIEIPYPTQVQLPGRIRAATDRRMECDRLLRLVEIFEPLNDAQRSALVEAAQPRLYGSGERIVREGDPGASMFVLARGEAVVTVTGGTQELARFREPGAFFGEMSLLTGEPRTATVTATTDCELFELTAEAFRTIVLEDASLLDRVGMAVATRRTELERHRAAAAAASPSLQAAADTLISRVRRFLRLTASV